MNSDKRNNVGISRKSAFAQIEKVHPIRMLIYLSMTGIGILFLVLLVAYIQARFQYANVGSLDVPRFFSLSTVVLLISSFLLSHTGRYYKKDNLKKTAQYMGMTMFLGVVFILFQLAGWQEIIRNGIPFNSQSAGKYVYLISALHIMHIIGGLIFLGYLFVKTLHASSDPVRSLIYIRDPFRLLQIKMLNRYWHFIVVVWVGLYFCFLFMM